MTDTRTRVEHSTDPGRPERGRIPVTDTVREAAALVRSHPRAILLPLAVVSIPLAIIIVGITSTLFLTAWKDEDVVNVATVTTETDRTILFTVIVLAAVEGLFAQVARAATIIAVAGVSAGKPPSLTEALDPAFTRLGALLLLVVILLGLAGLAFISIVGIVILPYLALRLALAFDVLMLEGKGAIGALVGSWQLMQGNLLRLLGVLLIAAAFVLPIIVIVGAVGGSIDGDRTAQILLLGGWSIVQSTILIPIVAFLTACTTLYYLKARLIEDVRPA